MFLLVDGHWTSGQRRKIQTSAEFLASCVLANHLTKIDKLSIRSIDVGKYEWRYGFAWLWNPIVKVAEIRLPNQRKWRSFEEKQWLLIHEFCHIEQLVSGRLKIKARKKDSEDGVDIFFRGKQYQCNEFGWKCLQTRKYFNRDTVPWENEIYHTVETLRQINI